ncbi:MAG: hypothetical protein AAF503_09130 [Pseudomonadota bacterium]
MKSISNQKTILAYGEQIITTLILELQKKSSLNQQTILLLENLFGKSLLIKYLTNFNEYSFTELKLYLVNEFWLTYEAKIMSLSIYGNPICENLERTIILRNLDQIWCEHLQKMTLLREAVGWRGYGQQNPLYEYKRDAAYLFETQKEIFRHLVIYDLLRSSIL